MTALETFIARLGKAGFEVDAELVLDTLWFATLGMPLALFESALTQETPVRIPEKSPPPPNPPESATLSLNDPSQSVALKTETTQRAPIYAHGAAAANDRARRAALIGVPTSRSLRDRLEVMRALRPFRQRWLSRQFRDIDEAATVEATAALRLTLPHAVMPALVARREPWFDVDLVFEDDPVIEVWNGALREFARVLTETGAFRSVRSWRLRMADDGSANRATLESETGARILARQIAGRGARSLIFFANHGFSERWADGSYASILGPWCANGVVLLLNLMRPHRWAQGVLGEPSALCWTHEPGTPTGKLHASAPDLMSGDGAKHVWTVPVAPLEARALSRWASAQMAHGRRSPAVAFKTTHDLSAMAHQRITSPLTSHEIELAIAQLRRASTEAFRLAVYLSPTPFTLPVARFVHISTGGDATDSTALAELLNSGLVKLRTTDKNADWRTRYFEFKPEVRASLLRSLRAVEADQLAYDLRGSVSRLLSEIESSPYREEALIARSDGSYDLPDWARPFAFAASELLRTDAKLAEPPRVTKKFPDDYDPVLVGAAARLAASGKSLNPKAIERNLWEFLTSADLVEHADQWQFRSNHFASLQQQGKQKPLSGISILWVDARMPRESFGTPQALDMPSKLLGAQVLGAMTTDDAIASLRSRPVHAVVFGASIFSDRGLGPTEVNRFLANISAIQPRARVIHFPSRLNRTQQLKARYAALSFDVARKQAEFIDLLFEASHKWVGVGYPAPIVGLNANSDCALVVRGDDDHGARAFYDWLCSPVGAHLPLENVKLLGRPGPEEVKKALMLLVNETLDIREKGYSRPRRLYLYFAGRTQSVADDLVLLVPSSNGVMSIPIRLWTDRICDSGLFSEVVFFVDGVSTVVVPKSSFPDEFPTMPSTGTISARFDAISSSGGLDARSYRQFTRVLIEGLRGRAADHDARVTAASLKSYVTARLRGQAKALEQAPVFRISGSSEFVLATVSTPPSRIDSGTIEPKRGPTSKPKKAPNKSKVKAKPRSKKPRKKK